MSTDGNNNNSDAKLFEQSQIKEAISEAKRMEQEINDILVERNALMSEYTKNISNSLDDDIKKSNQLLAIAEKVNETDIERIRQMNELIGLNVEFSAEINSILKDLENGNAISAENQKNLDDYFKSMKGISGFAKKYRIEIAKAISSFDGSPESAARLAAAIAKAEKASKGLEQAQSEISKISGQVTQNFGLASDIGGTLVGQMSNVVVALAKANDAIGPKGMGYATVAMAMEMFSAERILASMVQEAIKLAGELDKAGKAFGAATGFGFGDAQNKIQGISKNLLKSGVTMSDVGGAISELSTKFAGFDPSSINGEMVETTTLLAKIGVGAGQSAKAMDLMITAMGKTTGQAVSLTKELALTGRQIGVSATAMIENFNGAAKKLIEFGPQMVSVFKNLSIQAKITGMSMDNLIGIAEKFDTFEGASNQISEMNAVLGTQMSAMDMLNMTHDQRIQTIRDEVKASVGNFSTLDRYTQKYIAQAMGVADVEEAQRMLNMTSDKTSAKQKAAAEAQDNLKKITEELVPMYDKLKLAFSELVREMDPLINTFISFVEGIAKLAKSGHLETLIYAMGGLTIGFTLFGAAAGFASAKMKLIQIGFGLLLYGISMLSQGKSGVLALVAGAVLLTLALVFLNREVKKTTRGFGLMKLLFGSKINPLFIQSFAFMAVGVVLLALAFKMMGIQGTAAAYALAAVFAGMALVIYSLSFLVESISNLLSSLAGSVDILPVVAMGILGIAYSVGALGMAVLMSTAAIMFLMVSMTTLGGLFAGIGMFMGISALEGVGSSMDRIGSGMEKFANGLSKVKEAAMGMKGITDKAFMAFTTDGNKTSAIISSTDIVKNMVLGKMTVDVKIPEIEIPQVTVNIYMDGSLISNSLYETILEN